MRFILSIWVCKLAIIAGKVLGKKGSSTPGALALKICPNILKILSSQVRHKTVAVCGTNGKTTTNNLIYSILRANGYSAACNNVGANMLPGVTTAYIDCCNIFGKFSADFACIEVDEAASVKVFDHIKPDYMVITNLFRDQLDRYGEIEAVMDLLRKAIEKTPEDTTLILNADDPLCAALKPDNKNSIFYGISESVNTSPDETKEGKNCVFCGGELQYNYYHYSQLGDYKCPGCEFSRPAPEFCATDVKLDTGLEFIVNGVPINMDYKGFYNIYNILAAFSAVSLLGTGVENVNNILSAYKPQIGRMEEFNIGGVSVILNLSKNPAGFNQAISTMLNDTRRKDVAVIINDNAQDGTDVSWLAEVDFELMNDEAFGSFVAGGIRAEDVLLRMKSAGIDRASVEKDIKKAILTLLDKRSEARMGIAGSADPLDGHHNVSKSEALYILVNYTPLFETQNILKKLQGGEK